ncbi:MBL fold metallo-hydrolase [Alsobacter metallidurans]|uniref:MBL fold metallo-hydrolase n=1 Tax=Alsobacter metallidurans TaxID=340221 RepID=A0A917MJA2_9HYPH|nr:MBL fold metallo-hydrolase [Alsobacter metallidurans]GGH16288.1 MBL fold metallo-hydrolase [Alsobacter metallidurans]
MRLHLHGGFGEKGRTSVGVESDGLSLIFDVGINTSDRQHAYYPAISPEQLARAHAILITHAHEDHVGGLGWCVEQGFGGRVLMTAETRADMDACLAEYATPQERSAAATLDIEEFRPGATLDFGALRVETGRSGHAVGGVWMRASNRAGTSALYCGDVVPHSPVLAMDTPPPSEVVLFDASYGDDPVLLAERLRDIGMWVGSRVGPSLLPTPLIGRSLELIAALGPNLAIHRGMRASILQQVSQRMWLQPGMSDQLQATLSRIEDWTEGEPFPAKPLLVDDGMGLSGPSRDAIERAVRDGVPILLTGHLPAGSPAEGALKRRQADWIRLPTHPTWAETTALISQCGPRISIGHSCDEATLRRMVGRLPNLHIAATGDTLDVEALLHAHPTL